MDDPRTLAVFAAIASPIALILIVALLRGYRFNFRADRDDGRHRRPRREDDTNGEGG